MATATGKMYSGGNNDEKMYGESNNNEINV